MERKVSDVMHQGVLTCRGETTIYEAAAMMVEYDVSALVIVETDGYLAGLLSRTDLVKTRLNAENNGDWRDMCVADVMSKHVVCVKPGDLLGDAATMMIKHHIHRVVVVQDCALNPIPLGILSITDIVRDMALVEAI